MQCICYDRDRRLYRRHSVSNKATDNCDANQWRRQLSISTERAQGWSFAAVGHCSDLRLQSNLSYSVYGL